MKQTSPPKKILLIQTAFAGDVILSLGAAETLKTYFPETEIHYVVRPECQSLFSGHPFIRKVWVMHKKSPTAWLRLIPALRRESFSTAFTFQRYFRSGLLALCSGAPIVAGYKENPLASFFSFSTPYFDTNTGWPSGTHEYLRCNSLVAIPWNIPADRFLKPVVYPFPDHGASRYGLQPRSYIVAAPGSLWFTKRLPQRLWVRLLLDLPSKYTLVFVGSASERHSVQDMISFLKKREVLNFAGALSFLESAALMRDAALCIVQDSAPLHLASAVNARVCAIFGSTVPSFGFGPLSDQHVVLETSENLTCRPCGIHGRRRCPQGHFKCMETIPLHRVKEFLDALC